MSLTPDDDPLAPSRWTEQILKTSRKIDEATTGAIAAAAGTSFVFGFFTGGLGWMPFGAFASALLYRGYQYFEQRELQLAKQRLEIAELVRMELEAISEASLTETQKTYLTEKLAASEWLPPEEQKQLPP